MSQVITKEQLIARLASDVTRSPEEPTNELSSALEQLVDRIMTGQEPAKPLDWAFAVAQAVNCRYGEC